MQAPIMDPIHKSDSGYGPQVFRLEINWTSILTPKWNDFITWESLVL